MSAPPMVTLESPLPPSVPAGSATALFCLGHACANGRGVSELRLAAEDSAWDLDARAMPRFDLPCRRSGFWGVIPFRAPRAPGELTLRARSGDQDVPLGTLQIVEPPPTSPATTATPGLIAVCLATFEPQVELLARQLDSLRTQTDTDWTCVISDDHSSPDTFGQIRDLAGHDERFAVSRSEARIGFYRNFERALRMAPAEAELLAFCDQDDVWHPDKLAVLRRALGTAGLAYSDARLVDSHGRVLRGTMWRGRANNFTNLGSMLLANTVTGASSLFRRDIADRALPFPDSPGIEFHDHWIALVALASGEIRYVERPLYDYVQHESAILGKVVTSAPRRRPLVPRMRHWRAAYFLGYVPGNVRATTLLMRCGDLLTPAKRRALERYVCADASRMGLAWLALRPLRAVLGHTETLAAEWDLLPGVLWFRLARRLARLRWLPDRLTLDARFPDPPRFEHGRLQRWRARM